MDLEQPRAMVRGICRPSCSAELWFPLSSRQTQSLALPSHLGHSFEGNLGSIISKQGYVKQWSLRQQLHWSLLLSSLNQKLKQHFLRCSTQLTSRSRYPYNAPDILHQFMWEGLSTHTFNLNIDALMYSDYEVVKCWVVNALNPAPPSMLVQMLTWGRSQKDINSLLAFYSWLVVQGFSQPHWHITTNQN